MRIKNSNNKSSGFSLMEISLAILIIAILAVVTIPVITRQLEKSDEYAYYAAFRTVEKLASQIVALGDDSEIQALNTRQEEHGFPTYLASRWNDGTTAVKEFFEKKSRQLANTELHIFKQLFPKSFAGSYEETYNVSFFDISAFDDTKLQISVCSNVNVPYMTYSKGLNGTKGADGIWRDVTSWSEPQTAYYIKGGDADNSIQCQITDSDNTTTTIDSKSRIEALISNYDNVCSANASTTLADYIIGHGAYDFCNKVNSLCNSNRPANANSNNFTFDDDSDVTDDDFKIEDGDTGSLNVKTSSTSSKLEPLKDVKLANNGSGMIGWCGYTYTKTISYDDEVPSLVDSDNVTPIYFKDDECTNRGWVNGQNLAWTNRSANPNGSPTVNCGCKEDHVPALNNPKVCVAVAGSSASAECKRTDTMPYARYNSSNNTYVPVCCSTAFNTITGNCCPQFSDFNGTSCVCMTGYEMKSGKCERTSCPQGQTFSPDGGVCINNPPIIKAKTLCDKIKDLWNISRQSCYMTSYDSDNFFDKDILEAASKGAQYTGTETVGSQYEEATGGKYLSPNQDPDGIGAFASRPPHIVFANGQKLWILGNKSASIPGLSYDVSGVESNYCEKIKLTGTPSEEACKAQAGSARNTYFCKSENVCVGLRGTASAPQSKYLSDARTCCQHWDMSDFVEILAKQYQKDSTIDVTLYKQLKLAYAISGYTVFVDINGERGSGTLWEDVFPFYIATNGTVYPGYPLSSASPYLGGNSEQNLAADVYYYEIVNEKRKKVTPYQNISYTSALCVSRKISKYTPYCLNLGSQSPAYTAIMADERPDASGNYGNICDKERCFVSIRRKLRLF